MGRPLVPFEIIGRDLVSYVADADVALQAAERLVTVGETAVR